MCPFFYFIPFINEDKKDKICELSKKQKKKSEINFLFYAKRREKLDKRKIFLYNQIVKF